MNSRTTFGLATTAVSEHPRELAALGWRVGMVGSINWVIGVSLRAGGCPAGADNRCGDRKRSPADRHGVSRGIDRSTAFVLTDARRRSRDRHDAVAVQHPRPRDHRARGTRCSFFVIIAVIVLQGNTLPLRSFVGERLPHVGTGEIRIGLVLVEGAVTLAPIGRILNDKGAPPCSPPHCLRPSRCCPSRCCSGTWDNCLWRRSRCRGWEASLPMWLTDDLGLPFPIVLVIATLAAIPVGLIVGLPSAAHVWSEPRRRDARPCGRDPGTDLQQRVDLRWATRYPDHGRRLLPHLRDRLRQPAARELLRRTWCSASSSWWRCSSPTSAAARPGGA